MNWAYRCYHCLCLSALLQRPPHPLVASQLLHDCRRYTSHSVYGDKHITELADRQFIAVENTTYIVRQGMKHNGNNYTILPSQAAMDHCYQQQMLRLKEQTLMWQKIKKPHVESRDELYDLLRSEAKSLTTRDLQCGDSWAHSKKSCRKLQSAGHPSQRNVCADGRGDPALADPGQTGWVI